VLERSLAESPAEDEARPAAAGAPAHTHASWLRLVLEIALIAVGVFLGLAGDAWREHEQHRDAARASLRRFRTEILANRRAVSAVRDYHVATLASVRAYLAKDHQTRNVADVKISGLRWVTFEHTAWDLALATQSLSYLDGDMAYDLSRAYNAQQAYTDLTRGMTQAMYLLPPRENFDGFAEAVDEYLGDLTYTEPKLMAMYDELLPRIDRALDENTGSDRRDLGAAPSSANRQP
jgi:hypothetical protein